MLDNKKYFDRFQLFSDVVVVIVLVATGVAAVTEVDSGKSKRRDRTNDLFFLE